MEKKQSFFEQGLLFDPVVIFRDVIRKWFLAVVLTALISVAVFILVDCRYKPVYESSATLVITTHSSYSTVYANIESASALASVFSEILNSSVMKKRIMEVLDISAFSGSISATSINSTNLIVLKVRAGDPRTAFLTIQTLIQNHHIVTYDVLGDISVEVLQYPVVPTAPVNTSNAPGAMMWASLIAMTGVCVGFAVLSAIRDTVRSWAEAEKKLGCWCRGEIHHERKSKSVRDLVKRRNSGILVTKPETSFEYVTTLSKISRRIRHHMHGGNVLAVTSVAENEGKTTVATNLALSMAQKYHKILLIDCDLRKPACHLILEKKQPRYCINDVVAGKVSLQDAVVTDRRSGVQVLYARKVPGSSAGDILNSDGMKALIYHARKEYQVVVIDLPPMSVCADAEYMAEYADASLLVVRQNVVAAGELNRAISVLENARASLLGCVVNDVRTSFFTSGEGYGSSYGSQSYRSNEKYKKYRHYRSSVPGKTM